MPMTFSSLKILALSAAIIAALVVKAEAQAQVSTQTFVPHQTVAATPASARRLDTELSKRKSTPTGDVSSKKLKHLARKSPKTAGHPRVKG